MTALLPAMKEVGDKFGARRADPAVRAPIGRGDEEGREASRAVPREGRRLHQGQGRARDGVRRRARHRQDPRQHDPLQQRLHRVRPRQAGAGEHDHREGASKWTPTRSACRRCWSARRSRCRCACRSWTSAGCRSRCSSAARRSTARSAGGSLFVERRARLRIGRVLLQGRLRGIGDDGRALRPEQPQAFVDQVKHDAADACTRSSAAAWRSPTMARPA